MYAESNVTSCICHKLGICTLTNPSVGDVIYQTSPTRGTVDRLHHPLLDWSVCKFQACDRYRTRYSPHTSDTQYAYVRYSLSIIIILLPLLRGCFVHKLFIWDLYSWPLYRGDLYSGVAVKKGSTVHVIIRPS